MKRRYLHIHSLFLALIASLFLSSWASAKPPRKIQEIEKKHIAVDAMVVEVNEEYTRNLGLTYTLNRNEDRAPNNNLKAIDVRFPFTPDMVSVPTFRDASNSAGYILGTSQQLPGLGFRFSGMDIAMGRFSASLRALLTSGNAEIRARTLAVALHDTPVVIETVDEVPFQDVRYDKGQSRLDVSYEKVGVKLKAKPRIIDLAKERIELQIEELDLSSVTGYVTLQNVNRPVFAKSSANTRLEINNGETFIIGGFKIKRDALKESGIPFLRRIPLLGYLFKSERKVQENKDVLFFITPYILDPGVSPILPYDFQHGEFLEIKNIPVEYE
ncbi:type II and III secretion system protein [Candidatus Sumerlaeota bacterium]|nr:type II and III secretion system protein [Candidatus Sumerlaeota bacterium]